MTYNQVWDAVHSFFESKWVKSSHIVIGLVVTGLLVWAGASALFSAIAVSIAAAVSEWFHDHEEQNPTMSAWEFWRVEGLLDVAWYAAGAFFIWLIS